jgi:hypothetical protein
MYRIPRAGSVVLAAGMLCLPCAGLSAQETVTVTVRVEEESSRRPIGNAAVELVGTARGLADDDGTVRFAGLAPGRHTLVVRAPGYATAERPLVVAADTTVVVSLAVSPFPIDSIVARAYTFSLLGEVRSADARRGVPDADVTVGGNVARTDATGYFRMRRLPANDSLAIEVRAIGYLPAVIPLSASGDTTVRIELEIDPVGQAMIREQLARLDAAVNSVPTALRRLDRADLVRHAIPTLFDLLVMQGVRPDGVQCVVVDGRPMFRDQRVNMPGRGSVHAGLQYLASMIPQEVERVEIIDRGSTIRVYTYSWVRRELPRTSVVLRPMMGVCR